MVLISALFFGIKIGNHKKGEGLICGLDLHTKLSIGQINNVANLKNILSHDFGSPCFTYKIYKVFLPSTNRTLCSNHPTF